MKYRLGLTDLYYFRPGNPTITFLIVLLSGLSLSAAVKAQSTYWGLSADGGTSLQKTKDDTLTRQGLLFPTYGLSVLFGKVVSQGLDLKATLGYRTRGGVTKVDAVIEPGKEASLGSYKVQSRDHFITNDLAVQFNSKYWKVLDLLPFASFGVRNDFYLVTNSRLSSDDDYFKPENSGRARFRSQHHRNYVVGLTGAAGLRIEDWNIGLEYYHQVFGSFLIPSVVRANYSQLYSRSLQLNLSYRF